MALRVFGLEVGFSARLRTMGGDVKIAPYVHLEHCEDPSVLIDGKTDGEYSLSRCVPRDGYTVYFPITPVKNEELEKLEFVKIRD